MCTGLAIAVTELPLSIRDDKRLTDRVYKRTEREEVQFHWWQNPTLIPVQWNGHLHLVRWGSKYRRGVLPYGGWITTEDLDHGVFQAVHAEDVMIPANLGFCRGTWFLIIEGIKGILIRDADGTPVVYMLTQPSTNYYKNMTEQEPMMPALVGQVI